MKKILIALPCYNEEENITDLVQSFAELNERKYLDVSFEVLIINDASTDGTHQVAENLKKRFNFVDTIHHSKNAGLTGGINTAFQSFINSINNSTDYLGFGLMDGDNSHHPIFLINMYKKLVLGFDVVIASRFRTGSKVYGVTLFRQFLSFILTLLFKLFRNIPGVLDYSCGYRLYSPGIVKTLTQRYPNELVTEKSFACMVELLVKCYINDANCIEEPFILRYDKKLGESKMQIKKTIIGNLKILRTLR